MKEGSDPDESTGLQKLAAIGTGFMMVKRHVYEKMIEAKLAGEYIEDFEDGRGQKRWELFPMGIVHEKEVHSAPTYLTEDWFFFHNARKLGFEVWADNTFFVKHWDGATCYPTQMPEQRPSVTDAAKILTAPVINR